MDKIAIASPQASAHPKPRQRVPVHVGETTASGRTPFSSPSSTSPSPDRTMMPRAEEKPQLAPGSGSGSSPLNFSPTTHQGGGFQHILGEDIVHAHVRSSPLLTATGHTQTCRDAPTKDTTSRRGKVTVPLNFTDTENFTEKVKQNKKTEEYDSN